MRTVMYTPFPDRLGPSPDRDSDGLNHLNLIAASHSRSRAYGLLDTDEPDFSPQSKAKLSQGLDENKFLLEHAMPVMETLHEQIANTHNMVLLTSAKGLVLHSLGDMDFLEDRKSVV